MSQCVFLVEGPAILRSLSCQLHDPEDIGEAGRPVGGTAQVLCGALNKHGQWCVPRPGLLAGLATPA